jgi:ribosomal protein L15
VKQGASQQLRRLHTTIAHRQQREDVDERCRTGSQAGCTRGEGSEGSLGLVGQQSRDKDEAAVHVGGENLWAPVGKRLIGNAVRTGTWSDRHWAAGAKQSWAPL